MPLECKAAPPSELLLPIGTGSSSCSVNSAGGVHHLEFPCLHACK